MWKIYRHTKLMQVIRDNHRGKHGDSIAGSMSIIDTTTSKRIFHVMEEQNPKHSASKMMRIKDIEGLKVLRGEHNIDELHEYLDNRFYQTVQHEPHGALAEAISFQRFSSRHLIEVMPVDDDRDETQYFVCAHRSEVDTDMDSSCYSVELGNINGDTYRATGEEIEDRIIDLPKNALQFIEKHAGDIHPQIERVTSAPAYTDSRIGKDTLYKDTPITYALPDYRRVSLEVCVKRAKAIRRIINNVLNDTRYERFAVDVSPKNNWKIRIHRFKKDYVRRFKDLFGNMKHIPGVHMLGKGVSGNTDYSKEHDEEEDFFATFEEYSGDFSESVLAELHARLLEMKCEYSSLKLKIRELQQVFDDEDDGVGEFMNHPDQKLDQNCVDGVIVEIYKKK